MTTITTSIRINAGKEQVWDLLFNRFGEVSLFNPLIEGSHHSNGKKGEIGCERICDIDSNTRIHERISSARGNDSFDIEIIEGGLPMMDKMSATISLDSVSDNETEVIMTVSLSTKPSFMIHFMQGMVKKMFNRVLIGLKYHLETGKTVDKKDVKQLLRWYKSQKSKKSFLEKTQ